MHFRMSALLAQANPLSLVKPVEQPKADNFPRAGPQRSRRSGVLQTLLKVARRCFRKNLLSGCPPPHPGGGPRMVVFGKSQVLGRTGPGGLEALSQRQHFCAPQCRVHKHHVGACASASCPSIGSPVEKARSKSSPWGSENYSRVFNTWFFGPAVIRLFLGSVRPGNPFQQVGREAARRLEGVLRPPGPPGPPKSNITARPESHVSKTLV
jgi:hypothetical protein